MFEKNIGSTDRIIRAVVGLSLIIWAFLGGPWVAWFGVILVFTAITSKCYLYNIAGYTSCPPAPNKKTTSVRYNLKQ